MSPSTPQQVRESIKRNQRAVSGEGKACQLILVHIDAMNFAVLVKLNIASPRLRILFDSRAPEGSH